MTSDPLRLVWDALEAHGCQPHGKPYEFRARCPSHNGDNPTSLSVRIGADGRAAPWCDAHQCDEETITAALGLRVADLFPAGHHRGRRHVAKPALPPERLETRNESGKPAPLSEKTLLVGDRKAPGKPPTLAFVRDILARFRSDCCRAGVAGEEVLASLVYLAVTSRVLPWGKPIERPVSVIVKGTSSTGKSHAIRAVLNFFPEDAYVLLGSMSKKYLFYAEENFARRFVVVPEWASIAEDEEVVALLRTLLSEGRVIHGTVNLDKDGGRKAHRIEKEGPTGLLMTTTAAAIDPEMETRLLSVVTDDSPEQTRRVFQALAKLEDESSDDAIDYTVWHELQTWIAEQNDARVDVPFIGALADLMPVGATRLRRDFVSLLCLVRAHAILHQATRERDGRGRIVATKEDYATVRNLVADLIAEGADAGVSAAMRETVEAVRALQAEGAAHVKAKDLIDRMGVGQSAGYDRIHRAVRAGYLTNEANKNERGMKLVAGAPLPGEEEFLPSVEDVFRVDSGQAPGKANPHEQTASDVLSGIPGVSADPPDEVADRDEIERLAELVRRYQVEEAASRLGDEASPSSFWRRP